LLRIVIGFIRVITDTTHSKELDGSPQQGIFFTGLSFLEFYWKVVCLHYFLYGLVFTELANLAILSQLTHVSSK